MNKTKSLPIGEASQAQLRAFAEAYLGMSFPPNAKTETVRSKIRAAWTKGEILVEVPEEAAEPAPGAPPPAPPGHRAPDPHKVRIILQRTDEPGGDEPVPVGVNGRVMLIPRGEEVEIPMAYYEALKNAITYRYESLRDGGLNPVPRKVPMYPFQRIV